MTGFSQGENNQSCPNLQLATLLGCGKLASWPADANSRVRQVGSRQVGKLLQVNGLRGNLEMQLAGSFPTCRSTRKLDPKKEPLKCDKLADRATGRAATADTGRAMDFHDIKGDCSMSALTTPEATVQGLTVKQLWGRLWYSANRVDEVSGTEQTAAQRWFDACWSELIGRGEARLKMFNQGEELR